MERPYQKAEIQREVLDVEKIWLLAKIYTFKNTKSAVKDGPKKNVSRIEKHREVEQATGIKISVVGIHQKEESLTFVRKKEDISTLTNAPVQLGFFIWPLQQWMQSGNRLSV